MKEFMCEKKLPKDIIKNFKLTIRHLGGSIIIWSCFLSAEHRKICIADGIMNNEAYCRILDTYLEAFEKKLKLKNCICSKIIIRNIRVNALE